jgi:putative ABC transport system substrate-binding protein
MAVRRDGAACGTYLSSGLFGTGTARYTYKPPFFDELRRYGFIEGQNLTVEYRAWGLHPELISQYAAELVKARVDVITVVGNDDTVRAVQQATKTIPIVALAGDLLGSRLVNSLARPDGNTTGVNILASEADGKRQDILIEVVPSLR